MSDLFSKELDPIYHQSREPLVSKEIVTKYPLLKYHTGESKPVLRGIFHIMSAVAFPQTVLLIYLLVKKNYNEFLKLFIVAETQFIASSLLHVSDLKHKWIVTFDHICVFISLATFTNVLRIYNAPKNTFIPNIIFVVLGILNKLLKNNSNLNSILVSLTGLSCIFPLFQTDMPKEQQLIYYNIMFNNVIAFFCYFFKYPFTNHNVFSYHEIMHILTILNTYLTLFFIARS